MDELRYARLENRVDEIKDDVADVKAEQKIMANRIGDLKDSIKEHTETVKKHVAGDEKIITELQPILDDYRYKKERKDRNVAKLKLWSIRLAVPATALGIIGGLIKLFSSL